MKQTVLLLLCLSMVLLAEAESKKPCVTFRGTRMKNVRVDENTNPDPPPGCSSHKIIVCEAQGTQECKYGDITPPPPPQMTVQGNNVNIQFDLIWQLVQDQVTNGVNNGNTSGTLSVGTGGELLPYTAVWTTDALGVINCDITIQYNDGQGPGTE